MLRLHHGLAVVLALAACSDEIPETLAGRYRVTASDACTPDATLVLSPHADGRLTINDMHVGLFDDGSGAYTGEYGGCTPSRLVYAVYESARVARTSATTIHVETAAAEQAQDGCTPQVALELAAIATPCRFDAELVEAAPFIDSLAPRSISSPADCAQSLVLEGSRFSSDVRVGFEMTGLAYMSGLRCPSYWQYPDTDGSPVCNLVVEKHTSDEITAHLDPDSWAPYACSLGPGTLQLVVQNPSQTPSQSPGMDAYAKLAVTQ